MKLAIAAVIAIALCLLSLSVRHAALKAPPATASAHPAGRAPPPRVAAEKRALAAIDQRLHRKLRQLAASGSTKSAPVVVAAAR